jgi:hypothetical protein
MAGCVTRQHDGMMVLAFAEETFRFIVAVRHASSRLWLAGAMETDMVSFGRRCRMSEDEDD